MNSSAPCGSKRIGVAGCKHTTRDLIAGLLRAGLSVDHCVTIDPEQGQRQQVAGYEDLQPFLEAQRIPYTVAKTYSLKSEEDQAMLLPLKVDLLLVMGWQRLIPAWWLNALSIGAFGMHGSSVPLPHGRGRSPLNWSLIQGKSIFYTHLFKYEPGVDNGPVVGVQIFDITPFDTCLTLHFKNTVAMIQLCAKYAPVLCTGIATLTPQPAEGASYYPKRTAEDGLLCWEDQTAQIYNLIRAVTEPFPGAFTFLDDDPTRKVIIWRAIPFDTHLQWPGSVPGQILEVFSGGEAVVKTGDSTLLVLRCEGHRFTDNDIGRRFGHLGIPRKVWAGLPA